jgi:hypothetical protein
MSLDEILVKRPVCEICYQRPATELHHCLVHDMKRYHDSLTVPENLQPICAICHTSGSQQANSMSNRIAFAKRQIGLGYKIGQWYRSLPLKVKEQWILDLEDK